MQSVAFMLKRAFWAIVLCLALISFPLPSLTEKCHCCSFVDERVEVVPRKSSDDSSSGDCGGGSWSSDDSGGFGGGDSGGGGDGGGW